MNTLDYLVKRIDKKEIIKKSLYSEGVFDIMSFMFVELWRLLKEENRFFGVIPVYQHKVQVEINKINDNIIQGESDYYKMDIYGKILYLFKPILQKDYKRLCSRHLSKADAVIVLINKISEILKNTPQFEHKDELNNIYEIVLKLYNNIRNNAKKADLLPFMSSVNYYMEMGWTGKKVLHEFHIEDEDIQCEKSQKLEGSGLRFEDNTNKEKISEIVWTNE